MSEEQETRRGRRPLSLLFYRRQEAPGPGGTLADVRTLVYFGSLVLLVGLAGWLYLYQTTYAAQVAFDVRRLERRKERLHRIIVSLHAQVAVKGALTPVLESERTADYGFPRASAAQRRISYELPPPGGGPVAEDAESIPATGEVPGDTTESRAAKPARPLGAWQRLLQQLDAWMTQPVMP